MKHRQLEDYRRLEENLTRLDLMVKLRAPKQIISDQRAIITSIILRLLCYPLGWAVQRIRWWWEARWVCRAESGGVGCDLRRWHRGPHQFNQDAIDALAALDRELSKDVEWIEVGRIE